MWKFCVDKYEVSEYGELRNRLTGRRLKHKLNRNGYIFYTVSVQGKLRDLQAHREVARLFQQNNRPAANQVNHIDGVKANNYYENLEWVTRKENAEHAALLGLIDFTHIKRCPVVCILPAGTEIEYPSYKFAAAATSCNPGEIFRCCHGQRKSARGFRWRLKV